MQIRQENLKYMHIEDRYKKIISVVCDTGSKIDVGLEHLEKMMLDLPEKIEEAKVKDIANVLIETYKKEIERSIIESKSRDEKLVYPSISKAFIPQTYKMLEYTGKEKLEKKETWENLEEHNNMDSFWAKYCMAQQGMENLLLILGEPGGGKSLLTKIICARMIDENNLFIRVPLREVSVEKEIEDIVCDQIKKDGDASEPFFTFKWFAKHMKYNPITIVFDGYDEVLQATGRVYRGLLKKILRFQQECMDRHRPVRVVVTSRETLIDKADIPVDTLVMKLLEFNEEQKAKWIAIWNQSNAGIFRSEHINYFMLPPNDKNVAELSRQPLLLLMLAIYDANLEEGRNSLGQGENLNRTKLYNELLGRFIRRELRKGPRGEETAYDELPEKEKEAMVNFEMERLGIAALGMFTKGQLSLTVDEMNKCLIYMEAHRSVYRDSGRMLTSAEGLFGSFFFIHYSKSKDAEEEDKNTAFEFLHKTFYEFLVADLVLKYLVRAMDGLDEIKNSVRGDDCRYQNALNDPNSFDKKYYAALINTCFSTEPEIIEMIVEWKETIIGRYFHSKRLGYDTIIEEVFDKQIDMLCNGFFMPMSWGEQVFGGVKEKSYLQHCAIYFINLLILQITTKKTSERIMGKKVWEYVSQFWKTNLPEEDLLKFISLYNITKTDGQICIGKKLGAGKNEQRDLLQKQKDIFNFLQDDISYKLYGLHVAKTQNSRKQEDRQWLIRKGIDVEFEMLLGEMKEYILGNNTEFSLEENMYAGLRILQGTKVDAALVLDWILCMDTCLGKIHHPVSMRIEAADFIDIILRGYSNNAQIVFGVFACLKKIGSPDGFIGKNADLYGIFEKVIRSTPQLLYEYIDLLEQNCSIDELQQSISGMSDVFCYKQVHSWTSLAGMLKVCFLTDESETEELLDYIVQYADVIYDSSPQVMMDILRLCIMNGRLKEVSCLLEIGFNQLLSLRLECINDFLEVARMVGGVQSNADRVMRDITKKISMEQTQNPLFLVVVLKLILLLDNPAQGVKLINIVFQRFNVLFGFDPVAAIHGLRISHAVIEEKQLRSMLLYSVKNINYVLAESVEVAIDLLIFCKKMKLEILSYVPMCFNRIFNDNLFGDSTKIDEFLECMEDWELRRMAEYFVRRYLYIIVKYPNLAKKIAQVYHDSDEKNKFLDVVKAYRQKKLADRKYIVCLEQLWV